MTYEDLQMLWYSSCLVSIIKKNEWMYWEEIFSKMRREEKIKFFEDISIQSFENWRNYEKWQNEDKGKEIIKSYLQKQLDSFNS